MELYPPTNYRIYMKVGYKLDDVPEYGFINNDYGKEGELEVNGSSSQWISSLQSIINCLTYKPSTHTYIMVLNCSTLLTGQVIKVTRPDLNKSVNITFITAPYNSYQVFKLVNTTELIFQKDFKHWIPLDLEFVQ